MIVKRFVNSLKVRVMIQFTQSLYLTYNSFGHDPKENERKDNTISTKNEMYVYAYFRFKRSTDFFCVHRMFSDLSLYTNALT